MKKIIMFLLACAALMAAYSADFEGDKDFANDHVTSAFPHDVTFV